MWLSSLYSQKQKQKISFNTVSSEVLMASIMRAAATATATATATPSSPFLKSTSINHYHNYRIFTNYAPILSLHQFKSLSLSSSSSFRLNCRGTDMWDDHSLTTTAAAYSILGLEPDCSAAQLKAAFRAKVSHFITLCFLVAVLAIYIFIPNR